MLSSYALYIFACVVFLFVKFDFTRIMYGLHLFLTVAG